MNPSFPESIWGTSGAGFAGSWLDVSVSLQELGAACRKVAGCEVPIAAGLKARQADLRIFLANCSRLFARTNWRPQRGVTQIITDVFEWVRAHEKALQPLI